MPLATSCPKCGFGGLTRTYVSVNWFFRWLSTSKATEFLAVHCSSCGYRFFESPLDVKGDKT